MSEPPPSPLSAQAAQATQAALAAEAARAKAKPPTMSNADRELLPAALEILETPPAPRSVAFMLTLCGFACAALVWSFFGKLDVHAIAWGKIEADGRSKVVQPLEPGKVAAIHIENGKTVHAGDALIELDPAEAQADATAARQGLAASGAEIARRRVAIAAARALQQAVVADRMTKPAPLERLFAQEQKIAFADDTPESIRARERAVLIADLAQLSDMLSTTDKQMAQKEAMRTRLNMSITYQAGLIKTLEERVGVREKAFKLDVGTKINVFDARESLQKSQAQLASDKGQLIETDAAVEELISQKIKTISQFVADNETKLAESDRKASELAQQLTKSEARLARTKLLAPIDGVVQQIAVTTIGQVVTTGQQLMLIAPQGGALRAEVFVSNLDIGFVKVGQPAELKIDAFPFTRFGIVPAHVEKIAADAIEEQEAKRLQANALAPANSGVSQGGGAPGQPQNFVFPVTLKLDRDSLRIGDVDARLTPGMTVTAEIKTDQRRVIDYLLSPLAKIGSEAMRER